MLLNRLQLHNFKVFEGTHHLDFSVPKKASEKNIILIGGLNGAGKTTLLDAVKLCLYGKDNRDLWSAKESYNSYIVELLNKHVARKGYEHEMWVELEFEGVVLKGIEHRMTIRRRWECCNEGGSGMAVGQVPPRAVVLEDTDSDQYGYPIAIFNTRFFFRQEGLPKSIFPATHRSPFGK